MHRFIMNGKVTQHIHTTGHKHILKIFINNIKKEKTKSIHADDIIDLF